MIPVAGMNNWLPSRIWEKEALLQPSKVDRRGCHSKDPTTVPCKLILACVKYFTHNCNTEVKHNEIPQQCARGILLPLGQQLSTSTKCSSAPHTMVLEHLCSSTME